MNSLAAALLLWLPLLVFFKHNGYPIFRSEVGLCLMLVALAALFWGAVMTTGRTVGRVAVVSFLIVLVVDIQTGWITTWGLRLLLNGLAAAAFAWLFRRRLSKVIIVVAGAMILRRCSARPEVWCAGRAIWKARTTWTLICPLSCTSSWTSTSGSRGSPRPSTPDWTWRDRCATDTSI